MKPVIPTLVRLTCLTVAMTLSGAVLAHGFDDDGDDSPGYHGMMNGGAGMMGGPSGYRDFGMMNGTVASPGMIGPQMTNSHPSMMVGPMMGYGGPGSADLSDEQRGKMLDLQQTFQAHQLERMQSVQQQSFKIQKAYLGETPDKQVILDAQRKIDKINLKMLEEQLDTREKMQSILNGPQ